LLVGTNNPSAASRPFAVAFTPDGKTLLVSNFRANGLSFVDVGKALAGEHGAEVAGSRWRRRPAPLRGPAASS
jgi:DNA-binding beta-propeller fold protein YncE